MLRPKLDHLLGQVVVHVLNHTGSRLLYLPIIFTNNFGFHRPHGGESFGDHLGLKTNGRFSQHGVVHPASSIPRLRPLFHRQPKEVQTVYIGLFPFSTGITIIIKILHQLRGDGFQHRRINIFRKVGVKGWLLLDFDFCFKYIFTVFGSNHHFNGRIVILQERGLREHHLVNTGRSCHGYTYKISISFSR